MSKDSREIREIMSDIQNIISESYVFNQNQSQQQPQSQLNGPKKNVIPEDNGDESQDLGLNNQDDVESSNDSASIDGEIEEIRKIALSVIMKITPKNSQEAYKLVKGIWDSCDKFLTKDVKDIKPQQNNN